MKTPAQRRVSLVWRILFSTSIAITVLFVALGWVVQDQFVRIAEQTLEEEVRASFQAYESLWRARAEQLASVSLVLSRMPDVRGAFSTGDEATIRDTAREVWEQLSHPETLFLVCDPAGAVIAWVAGPQPRLRQVALVAQASRKFPQQARGFVTLNGQLYQTVITPVYVAAGQGAALLNVLVAGVAVDDELVQELKTATGGSEFLFFEHGRLAASTLAPEREQDFLEAVQRQEREVRAGGEDFLQFTTPLLDVQGQPAGELHILRPFQAARERIVAVRSRLVILWAWAVAAGIGLTYVLVRRLLKPVADLDSAAAEIAQGNYAARVPVRGGGEIGRLAETFNSMAESLGKARDELIRQERIATIGRLSTSIIHDLRNPLASIYGGAEMLVDGKLSEPQIQRLAGNIYNASRQVQNLLQELADVTQGRGHSRELCRLREVVQAACEPLAASAEAHGVKVTIDIHPEVELPLDRSPMERVFQNLVANAIEAMPRGGQVTVRAERRDGEVLVSVQDNGPGIPAAIADQLFQPFVTAGKKNGVGLGLALSRKTALSHGGDLWAEAAQQGARFVVKLPA
jgi:signal transduction histidine kinase